MTEPIRNALTVDVEDYFHASSFRGAVREEAWEDMESRVEPSTRHVLDLLAEFRLQGTFFILGWVARRLPSLVREIQAAGHELGCHSYAHRSLHELTPEEFRADTERALKTLEDASGTSIHAYRAPNFSLTARTLWAVEILLELEFTVDSSIFPIARHASALGAVARKPFRIRANGKEMLEFPPPTLKIAWWRLPVTGGAYLRLLPAIYQNVTLQAIAARGEPIVLYFHPWEFDLRQPRIPAPRFARFHHYTRLSRTEARLRSLLQKYRFGRLSDLSRSALPVYEIHSTVSPDRPRNELLPLVKESAERHER